MNQRPPAKIKYKCPKCGLKENEDHQNPGRVGRETYAKFHLCWFCLVKGIHVEMEIQ